jgi:hypothetical protein
MNGAFAKGFQLWCHGYPELRMEGKQARNKLQKQGVKRLHNAGFKREETV